MTKIKNKSSSLLGDNCGAIIDTLERNGSKTPGADPFTSMDKNVNLSIDKYIHYKMWDEITYPISGLGSNAFHQMQIQIQIHFLFDFQIQIQIR